MPEKSAVIPMSNAHFTAMTWLFKFADLFTRAEARVEAIPLQPGMVVVDYGCGPGRYTIPVARAVGKEGRVFAVDIQPLAIETVRRKAARTLLTNVDALLVDSYESGIPARSVDLALLIDTFHAVSDQGALLHKIHRMLKREARFFMDAGHMKQPKAEEIIAATGLFTIADCRGKNLLLTPK